ncbi:hypothetical protein Fleli_2315 [Bernardetia litoralis DSM 6794]|uniref:Uncharacterized protein n=1 Tax=Bernardetia litoralis (strain ATCC 23117 / DSM 6794 / NBRC 15988 / NCIMB 1366 / Fx l1 / Sio-4) TaxID=880071 RepID=I4AL53_BERLS|nr:hypothetical protein Fleli_2315 [Bernardetia litoralis DSM 6794]
MSDNFLDLTKLIKISLSIYLKNTTLMVHILNKKTYISEKYLSILYLNHTFLFNIITIFKAK